MLAAYSAGDHMKDFRDFKVWEKAHALVLEIYKCTADFPKQELFGLVTQMRRCSSSIPANIAEGCGRLGNAELHRFLQIACGSSNELNITCYWLKISVICRKTNTKLWT
jgi:four helix bundle protein